MTSPWCLTETKQKQTNNKQKTLQGLQSNCVEGGGYTMTSKCPRLGCSRCVVYALITNNCMFVMWFQPFLSPSQGHFTEAPVAGTRMEKLRAFCLTAQPLGGRAGTQGHGAWSSRSSQSPYSQGRPSASWRPRNPFQVFFFPFLGFFIPITHLLSFLPSFSFLSSFLLPCSFTSASFNLLFYCFIYFVSFFSLDKPGPTVHYCRTAGLRLLFQPFSNAFSA